MNRTAPGRVRGRGLLAAIASLTLLVAGMAGVAFASPAAASNSPSEVCSGYGAWARIDANGNASYSHPYISVGATGIPGKSGTWTSNPGAAVVYLHAGDGQTSKNMGSGTSGSWGDANHTISTLTFCYPSAPPPPPVCPPGSDKAGQTIPDGQTEAWCTNPPPVCPPGSDKAGQTIPDGQTDAWCSNTPPPVCPPGSDKAGQTIPDGQTQTWCTNTPPPPSCETDPSLCTPPPGCDPAVTDCTPTTTPPSTPPSTPTSVSATSAATVAKPKPAKVVLPATVEGGVAHVPSKAHVASKATVPSKATLPAAVPAGEGSDSLPLWALALMVIGLAGALGAGSRILGARR